MSWVAVAVGGAALVGAGASYYASEEASDSQDKATDAAAGSATTSLEFQKAQYQDWESVYGPVQDNLAEFYQNYDAEEVTSLGLQNIEREYNTSKDALVKEMSQRGLDISGLTAAGLTQLEGAKASEKSAIRSNAPLQAAQAQQSFLGMGLGLESSLQQGISGAYNAQTNLYGNQAAIYGNQAAIAGQGVSQGIAGIGSAVGTYYTMQGINQPTTTTTAAPSAIQTTTAPTYIPQTSQVLV